MKYYVRTTFDRTIDRSYDQIDYEIIADKEYRPIDSFIKALYQINNQDAILLEDDLILCDRFKERIEEAIKEYPNRIINFFNSPGIYKDIEETNNIGWNQCTFYPNGIAGQIAKEMERIPRIKEYPKCNQYSIIEYEAMQNLGLTLVQYRPHLVQHLDIDTLLFDLTCGLRRSRYFIDYLDELGINYKQAKDHKIELEECMIKHFKQLWKEGRLNRIK